MSIAGATTVVGDYESSAPLLRPDSKGKARFPTETTQFDTFKQSFSQPTQDLTIIEHERPFFITIDTKTGVLGALAKLDKQLTEDGQASIFSKKEPVDWIGHELTPGTLGLVNHGGLPKLLTKPGRYPPFPFRNWWARRYCGLRALSDTVMEFQGLTIVQVSQNQAAVVSDAHNKIFVVKNSGFVALALTGNYNILTVIDQTHLDTVVKDNVTKAILGWTQEVRMRRNTGSRTGERDFVVALFLNIPANNCAILQKGDDLQLLPAGQHYIIDSNTTLRGMFTCGENQLEMPTKDIYTRAQVPVALTIYLKWQLMEPLKLTTHGYNTPYDALRDKTQSVLTQIVSHLDYSSMVKQRSLGPDNFDEGNNEASAAFLDALRTRAMDDLYEAAKEYGIALKDLAVIDRQFKGDIARTMDNLTTRALQAQVEAANVDRENSNKVKIQQGLLEVARVQALARRTEAEAQAYAVVTKAKADAEALQIAAQAQAAATRMAAQAEADAIGSRSQADQGVQDAFAREMSMRRVEVSRVQAFGNRAVFVPTDSGSGNTGGVGGALALGMGMAQGLREGQRQ
jgi:regulator of protease activity HflC (stomatin/prohibitin superfamily)